MGGEHKNERMKGKEENRDRKRDRPRGEREIERK